MVNPGFALRSGILASLIVFGSQPFASAVPRPPQDAEVGPWGGQAIDGYDRPEPPGVDPRPRREGRRKAMAKIREIAIAVPGGSTNPFSTYVEARNALSTICTLAGPYEKEPIFRLVATMAAKTRDATHDTWGPLDEKKVFSALKAIHKTTFDLGSSWREERTEAMAKIRALASEASNPGANPFASHEDARTTLSTIRTIAGQYSRDALFRSVADLADKTLETTREKWAPSADDTLYAALKSIVKLFD